MFKPKSFSKAVIAVLVIIMLLAVVGCGQGSKPTDEAADDSAKQTEQSQEGSDVSGGGEGVVIGWSQRALAGTPWYEAQVNSAKEVAKANGAEIIVLDAQNKPEKQVADLEDLVSKQVDVIIIDAVHPTAVATGVKAANNAGIPVIAVDSAVDTSAADIVTLITSDNYTIGYDVGRELAKIWNKPDEAKVVIMSGAFGDMEGWQRRSGFLNGFAEYQYEKFGAANIKILAQRYAGDWDPENAMSEMEDILVKFPKQVDILFSEGDAMALGCLNAAKSAGEEFLVGSIDGQLEAIEALMDGKITAIGVNSAVETGKTGVERALAKLRGEQVQPRIYVPSPTITKGNVKEHYKPGVPFL